MGNGKVSVDCQVEPYVCVRQLNHRVVGVKLGHLIQDLSKSRVGPVDQHRGAVQGPLEDTVRDSDGSFFAGGGGRISDSLGDVGNQVGSFIIARVRVVVTRGGGCSYSVGVSDNTTDVVRVIILGAGRLRNGSDPEVVSDRGLVGSNDNVVALSHTNVENSGVVWLDRNEISCDNLHGVVVDGELEVGIDSTVNQSHAVGSSRSERDVEPRPSVIVNVGAVDETSV